MLAVDSLVANASTPAQASTHYHKPSSRNTEPETRNPKTRSRNPEPANRNPEPATQNPKPEIRSPKPETRNPKPETRNQKLGTRSPKPETGNQKPETQNPEQAARETLLDDAVWTVFGFRLLAFGFLVDWFTGFWIRVSDPTPETPSRARARHCWTTQSGPSLTTSRCNISTISQSFA